MIRIFGSLTANRFDPHGESVLPGDRLCRAAALAVVIRRHSSLSFPRVNPRLGCLSLEAT